MRRNVIETLMGAVVLAVAGLFLTFAYSSATLRAGTGYEIIADFNKLGGVKVGSDVRISGIAVGTVTKLSLNPQTFRATVTMTIDDAYRFPEDTTAAIGTEGLLGGNFVDLVPGGLPDLIEDGGSIEFTQDAVDIVQLLGKFIFSAAGADSTTGGNR